MEVPYLSWSDFKTDVKNKFEFDAGELVVPLFILDAEKFVLSENAASSNASISIMLRTNYKQAKKEIQSFWTANRRRFGNKHLHVLNMYPRRNQEYKNLLSYILLHDVVENEQHLPWSEVKQVSIDLGIFCVPSLSVFEWSEEEAKRICNKWKNKHEIWFRKAESFVDSGILRYARSENKFPEGWLIAEFSSNNLIWKGEKE